MKPFMSTEELLALIQKKEEPACTAALEALRLSLELGLLQTGVRTLASGCARVPDALEQRAPAAASVAATLRNLFDRLSRMPEDVSSTTEDAIRKMLGPHADALYRRPDQS
jgi:hypothetical protein